VDNTTTALQDTYEKTQNLTTPLQINITNPYQGTWIAKIIQLQEGTINYTITSNHLIERKPIIKIPECNACHNSSASGGAFTEYEIPEWNPGFAHTDMNGDGVFDVQCRMCHNSMHNITIRDCHNCHTAAPISHPISEPDFSQYTPAECLACHGDPHNVSLAGGTDCVACHTPGDVNISLFARHANINTSDGVGVVSNFDCWTCHFERDMNRSHVYLCDSCHVNGSGVVPVNDSSLIITGFQHGLNDCKDCHAPDTYHVSGSVGPRGRVENPGWSLISPVDFAGCQDCHYNYNGQDVPFHAPGKDHYNTGGQNNGSDCGFSCHGSPTDPHSVNGIDGTLKPVVSLSLSNSTVNSSESVVLNATAVDNMMQVELIRYQLRDSAGSVVTSWSDLVPVDGRFDSKSETGTVTIDTSGLFGNYTVEVRAMAGAPRNVSTQRYYPDNGDWSTMQTAVFTVMRPGYIDTGSVNEEGYLWSARRSGLLGSDRYDFGGTPETTVAFESDGEIIYRFGWLNQSALYKVNLTMYQKAQWWFGVQYPTVVQDIYFTRRNNNPTLRHHSTQRIPCAAKHTRQQHHRQL
jgi:hypothetical protein